MSAFVEALQWVPLLRPPLRYRSRCNLSHCSRMYSRDIQFRCNPRRAALCLYHISLPSSRSNRFHGSRPNVAQTNFQAKTGFHRRKTFADQRKPLKCRRNWNVSHMPLSTNTSPGRQQRLTNASNMTKLKREASRYHVVRYCERLQISEKTNLTWKASRESVGVYQNFFSVSCQMSA